MKILFDNEIFSLQDYGGISRYFYELMSMLYMQKIDFDCPLLYSSNAYIKDIPCFKFKFFDFDFIFKNKVVNYLKKQNRKKIKEALIRQDFDIFHPTYCDSDMLEYLGDKPYIYTVHDMSPEVLGECNVACRDKNIIVANKKKLIENASKIIAVSKNTRNDILKIYPHIAKDKISVIHHGNSFYLPKYIPEYSDIPQKYILFVGERKKHKNFNNFIKAAAVLLKSDKDLRVVVAGSNSFNQEEYSLFEDLKISKKIIHMFVDDLKLGRLYQNASCFVFPSLYEGFGFPLIEAFNCGCPVVCSNTSCFPEIAENAAIYFNPYDVDDIVNKINEVLSNGKMREELVNAGYMQASKYHWQNTAQKTLDIYKSLC